MKRIVLGLILVAGAFAGPVSTVAAEEEQPTNWFWKDRQGECSDQCDPENGNHSEVCPCDQHGPIDPE